MDKSPTVYLPSLVPSNLTILLTCVYYLTMTINTKPQPILTQKQEGFTLDLFKGLSETDAYKNHYSTENSSIEAIYVNACRLSKNAKVLLRLAELRTPLANAVIATVDERKELLTKFAKEDNFTDKGNLARAGNVQAIAEHNKMDGSYAPIKHQVSQRVVFIINRTTPNTGEIIEGEVIKEFEEGDEEDNDLT